MAADSTRPSLFHYWHEAGAPDHVDRGLASFRRLNPELEQKVFDRDSAAALIAACYGERHARAFCACAVPAMQADYFRYCAVHALGGVYADANFTCRRSLSPLLADSPDGVLFGRRDPLPEPLAAFYGWPRGVGPFRAITNSIFAFREAGHALLELAIEIATANVEARVVDGAAGVWVGTGPGIFTSLYLLRELGAADRFIDYAAGSVIGPVAPLLCEVVGDCSRVAAMWDGVGILPLADRPTWVEKVERATADDRWFRARDSIYM